MRQRMGVLYLVVLAVIVVCCVVGVVADGKHGLGIGALIGAGLGVVIGLGYAVFLGRRPSA